MRFPLLWKESASRFLYRMTKDGNALGASISAIVRNCWRVDPCVLASSPTD